MKNTSHKKQFPNNQPQQRKRMKDPYRSRISAFSVAMLSISFLVSTSVRADIVSTIDAGGVVNITTNQGSFTSIEMQALITSTADLTIAGVLDAEGTGGGDFSWETGALSDKISGASRYGRVGGTGLFASGVRWGYVETTDTWTPDAGLTHFGLITSAQDANDILIVTVTYSDTTTEGATGVIGQTDWMGFHKDDQTITSIQLSASRSNGNWANYDDVSLAFAAVPEPSTGLLFGLAGLALILRRRKKLLLIKL